MIFIDMTIQKDIERYFELNEIERIGILSLVSDEILEIIRRKNYNLEQVTIFLNNNISIYEVEEKYEIAEILSQIKQILEIKDGM